MNHPLEDASMPPAAAWLGYAGLLPFVAATLGVLLLEDELATACLELLTSYGAIILSFMGAVHWGLALRPSEPGHSQTPAMTTRMMTLSVVPALIGWAALSMRPAVALVTLAAAFAALAMIDRRYSTDGVAPRWYWRLRLPLTTVVTACLLLSLLGIPG